METKMWLVRATSLALVGSLTWGASAQKPPKKKGAPAAAPAAPPAPPPKPTTPEQEEEGPFAPKGRTGKLREEVKPEEDKGEAKPEKPKAAAPEKPGAAGLDVVFGFGKMGSPTGPDAVELSVFSFMLGGSYRFDPSWSARLRIPFATGNIKYVNHSQNAIGSNFEPLDQSYSSTSFGNIELAGVYNTDLGPSTKLPVELALALPTANGDRFPPPDDLTRGRHYRVNAAAAATRGMEEDALYTPHRFGIIPKISLEYRSDSMQTGAFFKLPILLKAGGASAPPQTTNVSAAINSTIISGVLGGDFHLALYQDKIDIGTRAWMALISNDPYDLIYSGGGVTPPSKFQFVLEPQARAAFGPLRVVLGFIWPLGSRLGGDQTVNGLRLMVAYLF